MHTMITEEKNPQKKVVLLEHNSRVSFTGQDKKTGGERGGHCCKEKSKTLIWCLISAAQKLEQLFTISIP